MTSPTIKRRKVFVLLKEQQICIDLFINSCIKKNILNETNTKPVMDNLTNILFIEQYKNNLLNLKQMEKQRRLIEKTIKNKYKAYRTAIETVEKKNINRTKRDKNITEKLMNNNQFTDLINNL